MANPFADAVRGGLSPSARMPEQPKARSSLRDGSCVMQADGVDGALTSLTVRHTFGIEPLQQYRVDTEAALGRYYPWPERALGEGAPVSSKS